MPPKSEQLQIRVTRAQKAALKRLARAAGQDVSTYVLARVLPAARLRLHEIAQTLARGTEVRFALAELNDLLSGLAAAELTDTVAADPPNLGALSPLLQNYVAAMIEQACAARGVPAPGWTSHVLPLDEPWFATPLAGLRLHLLRASPVAYKRRNLFVDAGPGARV